MGGRVTRLVGIEATSKGFCFVVLEDAERLIDWGGREVRGTTGAFIDKLGGLVDRYRPDGLVIEDPAGSRKSRRVCEWLVWAEEYASEREIESIAISRDEFRTYRSGFGARKHDLAAGLARFFPELEHLVPPPRRSWESERWRMGVFIALGRTMLVMQGRQQSTSGG